VNPGLCRPSTVSYNETTPERITTTATINLVTEFLGVLPRARWNVQGYRGHDPQEKEKEARAVQKFTPAQREAVVQPSGQNLMTASQQKEMVYFSDLVRFGVSNSKMVLGYDRVQRRV
jgi:hypothetical protein